MKTRLFLAAKNKHEKNKCDFSNLSNQNLHFLFVVHICSEFATSVGDYRFDDRLDDMRLTSYAKRLKGAKLFREEVRKLRKDAPDDFDLKLLEGQFDQYISGKRFFLVNFSRCSAGPTPRGAGKHVPPPPKFSKYRKFF